jgi:hypothetical protein
MTMNPVGRQHHNTPESLIQEFLNKGGEVKKFKTGARSEEIGYTGGFYGKRKKQNKETTESEPEDE